MTPRHEIVFTQLPSTREVTWHPLQTFGRRRPAGRRSRLVGPPQIVSAGPEVLGRDLVLLAAGQPVPRASTERTCRLSDAWKSRPGSSRTDWPGSRRTTRTKSTRRTRGSGASSVSDTGITARDDRTAALPRPAVRVRLALQSAARGAQGGHRTGTLRAFELNRRMETDFAVVWPGIDGYENPFGIDLAAMRDRFAEGLAEAMDCGARRAGGVRAQAVRAARAHHLRHDAGGDAAGAQGRGAAAEPGEPAAAGRGPRAGRPEPGSRPRADGATRTCPTPTAGRCPKAGSPTCT